MFEKETIHLLERALARMEEGFVDLPEIEQNFDYDRMQE